MSETIRNAEKIIKEPKAKTKKEKKLQKKLIKKQKKHSRRSLIKDILGDFSVQTGAYF